VDRYSPGERADLYSRLSSALKDRQYRANESALSAIIISLGILKNPAAKARLLPFVKPDHPLQVRRHALMSLASLDYPSDRQADLQEALFPILDDADYDGLVRHAVQTLARTVPVRGDQDRLRALLPNRHAGVRAYAVRALGMLDSATHAQLILPFLGDADTALRSAAEEALRRMPSAPGVILKALDENPPRARGEEMVRLLESHPNRLPANRARLRVKKMFELQAKGDPQYELHWTALRHLRGDILQAEILHLADEAFAAKNYAGARDRLLLFDGSDLLGWEARYKLAVACLKTSRKDRARNYRASDPALEQMAALLAANAKGLKQKLFADRALTDEDLFYVGFHFSERLNEERRFGADVLVHVAHKWPRRATAKAARTKLAVEGH